MANVLSWVRYPVWTFWQFLAHPLRAIRNTNIVLAAFLRTLRIGIPMLRILRKHAGICTQEHGRRGWSLKTRGRFTWRVAQKFWARWILEQARIRVNITGYESIDWTKPHVIVVNHQSTIDALLLVAILPNGRYVAKKEVLSYPIIGQAARQSGQIIIDRQNHIQAMRAIRQGIQDWPNSNLIFFAEGTRTRNGMLGEFKRGAFAMAKETNLSIVPMAISGTFEALHKGSLLRLKPNPHIYIKFGREISPNSGDVVALTLRTRTEIAEMLGEFRKNLLDSMDW